LFARNGVGVFLIEGLSGENYISKSGLRYAVEDYIEEKTINEEKASQLISLVDENPRELVTTHIHELKHYFLPFIVK